VDAFCLLCSAVRLLTLQLLVRRRNEAEATEAKTTAVMSIIQNINNLENKKLFWRKHPTNVKFFFIKEQDKTILLRLNNFPEEPLLTIINGMDIYDIEERPITWELED